MDARIAVGLTLLGALVAGVFGLTGGRDYRARSFVIRVPPDFTGEWGLERARGDAVLRRALVLAGEDPGEVAWLRERSTAELTSRMDLSFTVTTPDRERSTALATAYAKAFRREIPTRPGLTVTGRGARGAERRLGPVGWTLLGGLAGLWLGTAVAILREGLRRGSAPEPRPASPPCEPLTPPTRG
jgi:hypothetical protein